MQKSYFNVSKVPLKQRDSSSGDADSDYLDRDPGREVIEKNLRNRLQRIADHTKDELNKVLKRVDTTLHNYEYSVQSSLIQHGMSTDDMSNVEQVADIKELENLLNDSLAKSRYKQRLMVFIVGQTEQASEKAKLLQQIEQFFNEQKQNFGGNEFYSHDEPDELLNEVDVALKSFDVKDCFVHVKHLGTRLNELNDEIIQYLVQNAGTKQQAKGKKKLAQAAKETKEQLTSLQTKLEAANTEMINKDNRIEALEKDLEVAQNEIKTSQGKQTTLEDKLHQYQTDIATLKKHIKELEDNIDDYKNQIDDLTSEISTLQKSIHNSKTELKNTVGVEQKSDDAIPSPQSDVEQFQSVSIPDQVMQTSSQLDGFPSDDTEDLNVLFNPTEGIDLNDMTPENLPITFANLRKFAIIRIRELLKELQISESTVEELNEFKARCEKEQLLLMEKAEDAYQLQIKAQKMAEEAFNHLELHMIEQEKFKNSLIHQHTQTNEHEDDELHQTPEATNPLEDPSSSDDSKVNNDKIESRKSFHQISFEEKKQELDQLKQQADIVQSRPSSMKERTALQSLENSTILTKQRSSLSSFGNNNEKENQPEMESEMQHDEQQQTSLVISRHSSKLIPQMTSIDQFKLPFFHLYELIYKFRHSIISLLEQNQFESLADRLQMIKQLSSDDTNHLANDFLADSEHVLKDLSKVMQICLSTLVSTINDYQRKEAEVPKQSEPSEENRSNEVHQTLLLQEKESMIMDLTMKYEQMTEALNRMGSKHKEEINHSDRLITDLQKLIQNLQQESSHLQKRLIKIETEGVIEPSIMFTRLDAERNAQTLQQAFGKGKVPETLYSSLSETMSNYIRLPSQQLSNLVNRYMHFRRAVDLQSGRMQSQVDDRDTEHVLDKMGSLYERRADQIGQRISNIRHQRVHLARTLTEQFDQLEDKSSVFLIRPIYSNQGRAATQSYMRYEKERRKLLLNENEAKRKHDPSRQSMLKKSASYLKDESEQVSALLSPMSNSDDDERRFHIEKSYSPSQSSPNAQQDTSTGNNTALRQISIQMSGFTRIQELDIQRALLPVSHTSAPLLGVFSSETVDPCVPSLNLRSYVALSRPGVGNIHMKKSNEAVNSASREDLSTVSAKSQFTNPRTPFNSSAGDLRRKSPPLPAIRRTLPSSVSSTTNEKQRHGFTLSASTNEESTTNQLNRTDDQ